MKRLIFVLLALALAVPVQAIPLDMALDNASQRFDVLWDSFIVDSELDWIDTHGAYGQCIHTQVIPENSSSGPIKQEKPVTDVHNHHSFKESCQDILGPSNINVNLPFAVAVHVYNGPQGKGFVAQIWTGYEGAVYTTAKHYGPEAWRAFDWREVQEGTS